MSPMHKAITRLSRCPCCVSKYSRGKNKKSGKGATRQAQKRDISKQLGV